MTRRARFPRVDPIAAVTTAEANLARLLERRELALEGRGPAPQPRVIEDAERALEAARERLRLAVAS